MTGRKLFLTVLGIVLSGWSVLAQIKGMPVFKQISHPFMPSFTSEYFYFSADGLMWFSTTRGLTSFDGSEIVYYSSPEQAETLRLSNITVITEDSSDNLYIGTESNVITYNRISKRFTVLQLTYPTAKKVSNMRVRTIYIDKNRFVYIGFTSIGMQVYDLVTKKTSQFSLDNFNDSDCKCDLQQLNTVSAFMPHRTNGDDLWVGTFNGIYLFNKKKKTFSKKFSVENPMLNIYRPTPFYCDIRKMDMPDDSTIWFSTSSNGFGRYSIPSGNVKLFLHNARLKTEKVWKSYIFRSFANWQPGKYILGVSDPHPGVFDTKNNSFALFTIAHESSRNDGIQYATNDRNGNVWVLNNGRLYATIPAESAFRSISIEKQQTKDYLPNQLGKMYYDTATHQYYAAIVFSSGINVYDSSLQFVKTIPAPLYTNKWTYKETCTEWITKDGSDRLWATGMETYICLPGQSRFEYAEKIFPQLKWITGKGEALDIISTNEGNVLLRFLDGTVYHIRHDNLKTDTITIPKVNSQTIHIGTSKINYDNRRGKIYLNNEHSFFQYDLLTRGMIPISTQTLIDRTEVKGETVDYTLDDTGNIWIWIPSYGIRIIDPVTLSCIDSLRVGTRELLSGNYNYIRNGGPDLMFLIGGEGILIYNYKKKQSWLLAFNNGIAGPFPYFFGRANKYLFANDINKILYYDLNDFSRMDFSKTPVLNTVIANDSLVYTRNEKKTAEPILLKHNLNNLSFSFSAQEFYFPERIEYAYMLTGIDKDWHYTHPFNRRINYTELQPGTYIFRMKAQMQGGNWQDEAIEYKIQIIPAPWQTRWFKFVIIGLAGFVIFWLIRWRIAAVKRQHQKRVIYEKQMLELEAKALRSQMNPHFIFNSLNSIKSLINKNENDKAAEYLTTFSKLIRTLFQNSDNREISLYEELETCKLYTQIEKLRFGDKINFLFDIDEGIDLKGLKVPALILQPFIENAIWHGLVPKEDGGTVLISIKENNGVIDCVIEDNGIGRELSKKFKAQFEPAQKSRGIGLTLSRLDLDRILNEREDKIEMTDKMDENGNAKGTRVSISFKKNGVEDLPVT